MSPSSNLYQLSAIISSAASCSAICARSCWVCLVIKQKIEVDFLAIQERVELAGECQNGFDMISLNRRVSSFKLIISFSYVSQSEFSTPAPSGVPGRLEDSRLGATVKPLCYTFRVVYFKLPASSRTERAAAM